VATGYSFFRDVSVLLCVCIATVFFGLGFWTGQFNSKRLVWAGIGNTRIERELAECRKQLKDERAVSEELRANLERERAIAGELGRTIAEAGNDIKSALNSAGRAATTVSEIQTKVSLLADCLGCLKRRFDGLDYRAGD